MLDSRLFSAAGEHEGCQGCIDWRPPDECAACGKRARIALRAGTCWMTFCADCWRIVKAIRAEAKAAQDRQRQPACKRSRAKVKGAA